MIATRALVAGWFSYEQGCATAGDILARDVACDWLKGAGVPFDVATAFPFAGDLRLEDAVPCNYSHVVFVCGPFGPAAMERSFLRQFEGCNVIGLDLTMPRSLREWNPFDTLIERDSDRATRPDLAFASEGPLTPVVGVCLVDPYEGALVEEANAAIERLLGSRDVTVVPIDTRLDANRTLLRTEREVESILARMDVVVTTRLHGMVLALKHGVPVVAVDPEAGGAKILKQALAIGWPAAMAVDAAGDRRLQDALDYCLSREGREAARSCRDRAIAGAAAVREEFLDVLGRTPAAAKPTGSSIRRRAGSLAKRALRGAPAVLTRPLARVKAAATRAARGARPFGHLRQTTPISRRWGFDRGLPIDRHYIEAFLARHSADIRGRVLEVGDASYSRRFGGEHVETIDVLNVSDAPGTTIVADLADAPHIRSGSFDCIIVTQTLHLIYDVDKAVRTLHRILKPGGVLLVTVPGITRISQREHPGSWFWSFTTHSVERLFGGSFGNSTQIMAHGNVLAASAFLYGLASKELSREELEWHDAEYQLLITTRAVRAPEPARG